MNYDGEVVTLTGTVLTDGHRSTIVDAAVGEFGAASVVDQLEVSGFDEAIAGSDARVGALAGLIPTLNNNLISGTASLAGEQLTLTGLAPSADAQAAASADRDDTGLDGSADVSVDAATVVASLDFDNVNFEVGTAVLTADSTATLDAAAAALATVPDAQVEVQGHTDNDGATELNDELSQARADAVRTYLIDAGIEAERLSAVGYGESQPIADNNTEEGRAQNRRVELVVLEGN